MASAASLPRRHRASVLGPRVCSVRSARPRVSLRQALDAAGELVADTRSAIARWYAPDIRSTPDNWRWRAGPGGARRRGRVRPRRRAVRCRRAVSTCSTGRGGTGTRSSTPAVKTRSSTRWRRCCTTSTSRVHVVLLTARPDPGAAPDVDLARPQQSALGSPDHARLRRLRGRAATSRSARCRSCGHAACCRPSPSRTTGATSRCSTVKACPASTSTPATSADGVGRRLSPARPLATSCTLCSHGNAAGADRSAVRRSGRR